MKDKIEALGDIEVNEFTEKQLNKIDFTQKRWVKSKIHCNKLESKEEAIERICLVRDGVLECFLNHKDEIHTEVDPSSLSPISKVFDLRWWSLKKIENLALSNENMSKVFEEDIQKNLTKGIEFIKGVKAEVLMSELRQVILKLKESTQILEVASKENTIMKQWKVIFKHPQLRDLEYLQSIIIRVSTSSNSEAGCEQSNSKYNRAKNKLSSRMKLPMIKARMRAGSNGPPIHLFNPEPILEYWQENHHRLAEKSWVKARDESVTITRIRKEEEKKYTSTMFV